MFNLRKKIKIRWVDCGTAFDGIALWYLNEIHINKKWKGTKIGKFILKHELKHFKFIKEIEKSNFLSKRLLIMKNNIWDHFQSWQLALMVLRFYLEKHLKRLCFEYSKPV